MNDSERTQNLVVAWGLLASLSLAVITGIGEMSENFYTLSGVGMFVFGIWGAIILFRIK